MACSFIFISHYSELLFYRVECRISPFAVGAAVAIVGFAAYRVYAARKNASS